MLGAVVMTVPTAGIDEEAIVDGLLPRSTDLICFLGRSAEELESDPLRVRRNARVT